jgi:hypothetical protein
MTQGFRENRLTSGEEQATRVPMDFLTDAIRQAAPGVSDPTQIQDADTCSFGGITVTDGGTSGTDTLDIIYALGGITTTVSTAYISGTTLTVVDGSKLSNGDRILVSNLAYGHLFTIQSGGGTNTLTLKSPCGVTLPAGGYPAGSLVIRAQHATFSIGTTDTIPTLMMDPDATGSASPEPIADGVEDLQVAVGIDGSTDGLTETSNGAGDEWYFNATGEAIPGTGTWRAVRVTLVARSVGKLVGAGTVSAPPKIEDHAAGTADNYRRRVLRSTVEIRNTGVSP